MAINKQLQQMILSRLEDGLSLDELIKVDGFEKEIKYLEDFGLIECHEKPSSNESYYSCYRVTSYGRQGIS